MISWYCIADRPANDRPARFPCLAAFREATKGKAADRAEGWQWSRALPPFVAFVSLRPDAVKDGLATLVACGWAPPAILDRSGAA